jgi:hypothetical protein
MSIDLKARGDTAKTMQTRLTDLEKKLSELTAKYDESKKAYMKLHAEREKLR